jgi:AmmeMemoRadiSam system protein A
MDTELSLEEQQTLLHMAREAMEYSVRGKKLPPFDEKNLSAHLSEQGTSFITLTINGKLRGCIGGLEARQPLVKDVREHAVAAALEDPRFPPVREDELSRIQIEVSRLTRPIPLEYKDAADLLSKLRPHVDGVIVRDSFGRRATFLPQVWEKIPDPAEFMNNLCYKMGVNDNTWRIKHLEILVYQVDEFHESPDNSIN